MLHHLTSREKLIIMGAVMSAMFLAALDQTIVGTALPKILTEFNALKELTWVVTAYLLTSTIAVPISGKLSDLYGRRKLLSIGIVIFLLASLLCGTAQNIDQLIAYRAIQGIGGGILFANSFTIIGDLFAPRERGKWQGIIGAVFGLSSLIGPLLGGFLSDPHHILSWTTNWRWTFLINVPVGIVSFALIAKYLPTIIRKKDAKVDYIGGILMAITLACLVLACSLGGTAGWAWDSAKIIGLFAGAAVFGVSFVLAERRAKEPILPLHFFKNQVFVVAIVLMLLFGMAFFGAIIYIPTFAQQVLNFSATNSGVILLPMVIALSIASFGMGQVIHKTGRYKIFAVIGLGIAALGVFTLSTLGTHSTYWDLAWRMGLAGIGLGMAMPIFNLAVQNALPQQDLGVASSSVQLFRSIGSTVGLAIMGGVMNGMLIQKLSNIQSEPFITFAKAHGFGGQVANLDVNSIQGILSADGQKAVVSGLQKLPPQAQHQAIDSFHHLVGTLQTALASSVTHVFLISAVVMVVAFVVSMFLKEVPLRSHEDFAPVEPA